MKMEKIEKEQAAANDLYELAKTIRTLIDGAAKGMNSEEKADLEERIGDLVFED